MFTSLPIPSSGVSGLTAHTAPITGDTLPIVDSANNATKKITLGNVKPFFFPSSVVIVNSAADFPAAVGGKRTLATNTTYLINTTTVITDTLVVPAGGSVKIEGTLVGKALVYTGTGNMFEAPSAFGIFMTKHIILQATNGTYFDFAQNAGSFYTVETIWASAVAGGSIKCATFTSFFSQFQGIGTGINFENNSSVVSFSHTSSLGFRNVGTNMFSFSGNIPDIAILDSRFVPASNDKVFHFDKTLEAFGTKIVCNSTTGYNSGAGGIFSATSIKQDYIRSIFSGNVSIADSTVSSTQYFANNALASTIATINTPALINTIWGNGSSVKQRVVFQDVVTFDSTTDLVTTRNIISGTAEAHGLTNGDVVTFATTGTLPVEITAGASYYVVNATTNAFQISTTSGGSAINLSSNGTGTNYYRHATGNSSSGWIIYTGLEDIYLLIGGYVQLVTATGGGGDNVFIQPRKTSATFVESDLGQSATVNVVSGKPANTTVDELVGLKTGEGLRLYVVNTTSTAAVTCGKSNITMTKA